MATAIATTTRLEILESEINTEAFEAFYHIGQKLLEIKKGRLYENAGFKAWGSYCASGRIDYGKAQSDCYIRASELRPKMDAPSIHHEFSVKEMLELCKCETDNDAKRVAKKAIALAKKTGERVTARMIAQVRDGLDESGAENKQLEAALDDASLAAHLEELSDILVEWRISLEQVDLEQWSDLRPVVLTRVKAEARKLLKFLES